MKGWNYSVIPLSSERYLSTMANFVVDEYEDEKTKQKKKINFQIKFVDSYQFLVASLESLVEKLDQHKFTILTKVMGECRILQQKGIFPYSWYDSLEKLNETQLPDREKFHDALTDSLQVTPLDYERAQVVWHSYCCVTFKDYLTLYLKCDVLQLADVFENFRQLALEEDELDPVHYFSIPGLSWDSAFKMTRCEVEILKEAEMYQFFEKGIRGGMTFVNKHYVKTNHPSVPESYNPHEAITELLYIDINNLYGHSLSSKLPQHSFQWVDASELAKIDWRNIEVEGDDGYVIEVDLHCPPEIHDRTQDLPLAPESLIIHESWLSDHMRSQCKELFPHKRAYRGSKKLLLNVFDQHKYVVHFKLLQFYLKQGMRITKYHRGVKFSQASYFQSFIEMNSRKRQQTSDKCKQDYYKLKNNSLFGKTMENVRDRRKIKLCNNAIQIQRLASRDSFKSATYFTPHLVGIECSSYEVTLNKPVYCGQAVLDLSKLELYEIKYNRFMKYEQEEEKGAQINIVGGDTDSLFVELVNIDLDKLLRKMIGEKFLDTSNYEKSNPLYSDALKACLGCIKDESCGNRYTEWVLLRPKCYSMQSHTHGNTAKRAKGVQRFVVKNHLTHDIYKQVWEQMVIKYVTNRRIGSNLHQLYTIAVEKLALSAFDDKRCWLDVNYSLPYGYYLLRHNNSQQSIMPVAPPSPNIARDELEEEEEESTESESVTEISDEVMEVDESECGEEIYY